MSSKITLLIADENKLFSKILTESLEIYTDIEIVGITENTLQTIEKIEQKKPDIILLDIVTPKLNGIKVLKHIQETPQSKSIVFAMSAHGNEVLTMQALALGAHYFFVKPIEPDFLVSQIRNLFATVS